MPSWIQSFCKDLCFYFRDKGVRASKWDNTYVLVFFPESCAYSLFATSGSALGFYLPLCALHVDVVWIWNDADSFIFPNWTPMFQYFYATLRKFRHWHAPQPFWITQCLIKVVDFHENEMKKLPSYLLYPRYIAIRCCVDACKALLVAWIINILK
jgi:hypothetical protein